MAPYCMRQNAYGARRLERAPAYCKGSVARINCCHYSLHLDRPEWQNLRQKNFTPDTAFNWNYFYHLQCTCSIFSKTVLLERAERATGSDIDEVKAVWFIQAVFRNEISTFTSSVEDVNVSRLMMTNVPHCVFVN